MQQDDEDRKNEFVINGLEKRIEELENMLKKKKCLVELNRGLTCRSSASE
jgi:hypothetical protein